MPEPKSFFHKSMPNQKAWQREMVRQRGTAEAILFMERVQCRYFETLAGSRTYQPRVLHKLHFEKNILPAVAAYQVLKQEGHDPASAVNILDRLLETTISGQKRYYRFLGRFTFFFDLLCWTLIPMMRIQYPEKGWQIDTPDLGPIVVALDSRRCFYLEVLKEYGVPELTRHFCRLDDLLYEGVSAFIRFERTQTLGRGGELCDFRYYRVKTDQG
jgi:hypothetical protein